MRQPLLSGLVPVPEGRAVLRVGANLVLVPVTVTNNRGAVIPILDRNDFKLTEENRRQEIVSFSHETAPISLGLVVDLSGSMAYKIAKVHVAVGALLDSLEPEDEEFLVTFGTLQNFDCPSRLTLHPFAAHFRSHNLVAALRYSTPLRSPSVKCTLPRIAGEYSL